MVPEDSTLETDKTLYIYSQYLLVTRHYCKLDGIPENVISSKQEMYTRYMETSLFVHSCCVLPQVPFMAIRILDGQWESQTAKFKRMARCSMYGCTEIILMLQLSLGRCTKCMDNQCLQIICVLTRFSATTALSSSPSCLQ